MAKNANFGPNLVVFGPKVLIFTEVSKSFGSHIRENHLGTLFALFFGGAYGTKSIFWAKFGRFWAKNSNFYEREQKKMPVLGQIWQRQRMWSRLDLRRNGRF